MAKRTNLNESPGESLAGIVASLAGKTEQKTTHAAGIKDLGDHGDVIWEDTDPETGAPRGRSVRRFAVELDSTVERAAALEKRLAESEADLEAARGALANLRDKELPALKEQLAKVDPGNIDFSEFDAKIAAAEAKIAASEAALSEAINSTGQSLNEALAKERQERYDADAETQQAVARDIANNSELLNSSINNVHNNAAQALEAAKSELAESDAALSERIDGVFRNMTVTDTGYLSNAVIGELAARIAKVIELEASRITAGEIGAAQINVVELAGEVARFISLDLSQLTVTDKTELNEAVAQAIASRTAEFQEAFIQNLRTNGAAIDEAVIGDLAANIITSGLFRTAKEGQRWEIDSNGIVMYAPDDDGVDGEVVRLGPAGENLITVGDSTVSASSVSSPLGNFDSLTVGGDDLAELLWRFPKGVIAFAYADKSTQWDGTNSEVGRLQVEAELQPGRRYSVTVDQHFMETRTPEWARYMESIRYTTGGITPSSGSIALATARYMVGGTSSPTTIPPMTAWVDTSSDNTPTTYTFRLFSRSDSRDRDMHIVATHPEYALRITVRDEGVSVPESGEATLTEGTPKQGGTVTVTPTAPKITRTTTTWGYGSVGGDVKSGEVVQGQYGRYGNRFGGWTFPSNMQSALRGARIEKFEVYLYAAHWYYGKGGTASLMPNNGSPTGTYGAEHLSRGWPRNAGRWVTIPASWYGGISSGSCKGVSVRTSSGSLEYYGRFTAGATKFRATYTK
ncbi:MAG: hypothetical protein E6Y12_05435 [Dermabacter sp.]|nr:hypothetical protein [Dermabacter sp.]